VSGSRRAPGARCLIGGVTAAAICMSPGIERACATDRPAVGIVAPFSGAYAEWGAAYRREIDLYMFQHDGKDGNPKINLILRDAPGGSYVVRTKQVVQEFITRDKVVVAGGGVFAPEALAVSPLVTEARIPYVIFNGATSFIVDKSPYLVRVGYTIWQTAVPIAEYAAEHGCKRVTMIIADYATGADAGAAFKYGFEKHGGTVATVIKVPLGTNDFSSYMQLIKDSKPECVFPFMPRGPMALSYIKGFAEYGLKRAGIIEYGTGETTENYLDAIGDDALGIVTASYYSTYLDNPMNRAFIAGLEEKEPKVKRAFVLTQAYDGMALIYHMLKATDGQHNGDEMIAAAKGFHWMSPRGPVSIDPKTRDIVQDIYIRKVVKDANGVLYNKEIETISNVHDPWHELHPAQ
jgi:branched-chain amino acid transport system substrate-binding protein